MQLAVSVSPAAPTADCWQKDVTADVQSCDDDASQSLLQNTPRNAIQNNQGWFLDKINSIALKVLHVLASYNALHVLISFQLSVDHEYVFIYEWMESDERNRYKLF